MALPGLEQVGFSEDGPWQFPEKTVLVKTFALDLADRSHKRVETRFLTLQQGEWYGYSYRWDDDQQDARLVDAGGASATYRLRDGSSLEWRYPSRVECMVCHTRAASYVLGVTTNQMNRGDQLAALERLGVFRVGASRHRELFDERAAALGQVAATLGRCRPSTTKAIQKRFDTLVAPLRRGIEKNGALATRLPRRADDLPRLADPADAGVPLDARARSYLHANCAHCHVWAGGGNSAINLHVNEPLDKMKLVGEEPLHDRFGLTGAKLVAPGEPQRSILPERLRRRGKGQMPPLATARPDDDAVRLIREWIKQLK